MVKKFVTPLLVLIVALILESCTPSVKFNSQSPEAPVLNGWMIKPEGEGPFPAVVLLHGCSGIFDNLYVWASRLKSWGYISLIVDSLGPRRVASVCGGGDPKPYTRSLDAYDARSYLAGLGFVDPNRIAVMGFSHGGSTALVVATTVGMHNNHFQSAISFYPACRYNLKNLNTPLLILIGDSDDYMSAIRCARYISNKHIHEVNVNIYPGAYHCFDWYRQQVVDNRGNVMKYDERAAADAIRQVKNFLDKYLR